MIDDIVLEVKEHLLRGRKEIVLIAQDTTRFGKENNESLAALLEELVKIEELEMIDINNLTPIEAFNLIIKLKQMI
jgi:ribosomal protein S12 methylthiotransferase